MITIDELLKCLKNKDFNPNPKRIGFFLENAKEVMQAALKFFCQDEAKWGKGYDEIVDWLNDSKYKGLLLMGACGTGKTLICTKVIPAIMIKYYNYVPAVRSAYSLNRDSDAIIKGRAEVLIIDDIGVEDEHVNFGERSIVFNEIVDQAERLGQILILTTNLKKSELIKKYGARTVDRLEGLTRKVVFEGKSLRNK